MRRFRLQALTFLLSLFIYSAPAGAREPIPKGEPLPRAPGVLQPDETGMVPGDIILGNMNTFPGHAGIYVGRWNRLPTHLQENYANVYKELLIRSRDEGLQYSFLVIDSDGGRGTQLSSFAEQFTAFMPKRSQPNPPGALHWESDNGMAVAWPGLSTTDERRWAIIEEALKAAAAAVPYPTSHWQMETTYWGAGTPYEQMTGMDCVGLVHVAYYRGASIDLDTSYMPYHTPKQLLEEARSGQMARKVRLEPVWWEVMTLGTWDITISTRRGNPPQTTTSKMQLRVFPGEESLMVQSVDPETGLPHGERSPLGFTFVRTGNNQLHWTVTQSTDRILIKIDDERQLTFDAEGLDDDGKYKIRASGVRLFKYMNTRRERK